jgi:nitrogen fixation NifU-like protein
MLTQMIKGKSIEEAMKVTNKAVADALDGLPPVKMHCSCLAEEALKAALWNYAERNGITIEGLTPPANHHEEDHAAAAEEN